MAQRHRGDRRRVITRVPVPLADLIERQAVDAGMSVSEFVARQLAAALSDREKQTVTPAA